MMKTDVRLLISPAPAPDTAPKGTWQVDITLHSNLIKAKLPLHDPLMVEEAEDVRWYPPLNLLSTQTAQIGA